MQQWLTAKEKYPVMYEDGRYIEEALLIVQYWQAIHQQNAKPVPAEYPLKALWEGSADKHLEMEREFLRETRSRRL